MMCNQREWPCPKIRYLPVSIKAGMFPTSERKGKVICYLIALPMSNNDSGCQFSLVISCDSYLSDLRQYLLFGYVSISVFSVIWVDFELVLLLQISIPPSACWNGHALTDRVDKSPSKMFPTGLITPALRSVSPSK